MIEMNTNVEKSEPSSKKAEPINEKAIKGFTDRKQ